MKPDWKLIDASDPLYEGGKIKYKAPAYGVDDLRAQPNGGLPDVGPDDHQGDVWIFTRSPNTNTIGSVFVAEKRTNP
jgi:hypothetical protein